MSVSPNSIPRRLAGKGAWQCSCQSWAALAPDPSVRAVGSQPTTVVMARTAAAVTAIPRTRGMSTRPTLAAATGEDAQHRPSSPDLTPAEDTPSEAIAGSLRLPGPSLRKIAGGSSRPADTTARIRCRLARPGSRHRPSPRSGPTRTKPPRPVPRIVILTGQKGAQPVPPADEEPAVPSNPEITLLARGLRPGSGRPW